MAIPKAIASIKRFGPRYGRTVKHKFGAVEAMHRKKYKCPYCSKPNVKRLAAGIWQCSKCNSKFASRAYTIPKKKAVKIQEIEEPLEMIEEDQAEEDMSEDEHAETENEKPENKEVVA